MTTQFKQEDVVVLLGAGASADAGIPTSQAMIQRIETKLEQNHDWKPFRDLYLYLKSSILFGEGIAGRFDPRTVNYNIERLVATLDEIDKKTQHTLYPFVGTWNMRLVELAGAEFQRIRDLKLLILRELKNWISPPRWDDSQYYRAFTLFMKGEGEQRRGYGFPLRVFTLNYDLCLEHNCGSDLTIERGFDETRGWDWRRFEVNENEPRDVYLYKLHGSIDWVRDGDRLTWVDNNTGYEPDQLALIFGTNYKLQAIDPYLFFVYELRKWTLEARLIVAIGYGFGDDHINAILGQALNMSPVRPKMIATAHGDDASTQRDRIATALHLRAPEQLSVINGSGKDFMSGSFNVDTLAALFPVETADFPESGITAPSQTSASDEPPKA
jgi:hypothetical protein